jgi:hypothetical protein
MDSSDLIHPHHEMGDFERSEIDSMVICDLSEFYI